MRTWSCNKHLPGIQKGRYFEIYNVQAHPSANLDKFCSIWADGKWNKRQQIMVHILLQFPKWTSLLGVKALFLTFWDAIIHISFSIFVLETSLLSEQTDHEILARKVQGRYCIHYLLSFISISNIFLRHHQPTNYEFKFLHKNTMKGTYGKPFKKS
jgi:hypothetical protein